MQDNQNKITENLTERVTKSLGRYTDPKRLVMLLLFSLVAANSVYFSSNEAAKTRVSQNAQLTHFKIYRHYELAVERHKKKLEVLNQGNQLQSAIKSLNDGSQENEDVQLKSKPAASSWWLALNDLKKEYPDKKVTILVKNAGNTAKDKNILESITNKPRGFTITEQDADWVTSHFVLPTKNLAVISINSYVRDQLQSWNSFSMQLSVWVFILFMVFGWFWTRAQEDANALSDRVKREMQEHIHEKLQLIKEVISKVDSILRNTTESLDGLYSENQSNQGELTKNLEEVLNQIHLLAINGTIESLKNEVKSTLFQGLLQEINQNALRAKRLLESRPNMQMSAVRKVQRQISEVQEVIKKIA
jgi:hypothetical protein